MLWVTLRGCGQLHLPPTSRLPNSLYIRAPRNTILPFFFKKYLFLFFESFRHVDNEFFWGGCPSHPHPPVSSHPPPLPLKLFPSKLPSWSHESTQGFPHKRGQRVSTGAWDFTRPYLRGLKPLRVFTLPSGTTLNYSHPFYRIAGFFSQDREF